MSIQELLIVALISPLLLIPIEGVLPYPFIIEELFKYILLLGINKKKQRRLVESVLVGFLFNLTETFLYIPSIINSGKISVLWGRLFYTGLMHGMTCALMYFGIKKNKYFGLATLLLAMLFHFGFNQFHTNF
jgi:hypothetical protein